MRHSVTALVLLALAAPCLGAEAAVGIVVESVEPESAAARAGLEAGDVLLRWHQGDAGGDLVSPFDLDEVECELAPRGEVSLEGERAGGPRTHVMVPGRWGLKSRPELGGTAGRALVEALHEGGTEGGRALARLAHSAAQPAVQAWLLVRAAELGGVGPGGPTWEEAEEVADRSSLPWVHERHGDALRTASQLAEAAAAYSRALELRRDGSLAAARSLNSLGNLARGRGDLQGAEGFHRRALEIRERLAPESLDVAGSLNNLGNVAWARGDLAAAEGCYRRGLEIKERLAPGSLEAARSLNNLGNIAYDRGDLESAEGFQRRALEIRERLAPETLDVALSLSNLGSLAKSRGDLAAAEGLYRRALAIRERLAPGSLVLAESLHNLGTVAKERGDLAAAEGLYRRALEIFDRLAPGDVSVAGILNNLGNVAHERTDLEAAEGFYRRALEIKDRLAPGSLSVAVSLGNLADVALSRGDLVAAEELCRRSLAIFGRLAPDNTDTAVSFQQLAQVLRSLGRKSQALEAMRRAVRALEAQQRRLGGSPEQLGEFRAKYLGIYRELVELLIELGRGEEAFGVLESARARALLDLLAERDLLFSLDLPPDLERERRLVNRGYERVQASLAELSLVTQATEVEQALAELAEIGRHQEEIREKVRRSSPRLAAVQYPQPLDLTAARAALDPGTVLLAYSLGENESYLFVVTAANGLRVVPLGVGEAELRDQVFRVRRLVEAGTGRASAPILDALHERCRELYRTLVAPAEPEISAASRVLVMPDGALHQLPFAALMRDVARGDERGWQYLVEWRPLHQVVSTTVYAELRRPKWRPEATVDLVAFGDPSYPTAGEALEADDAAVRSVVRGGLILEPLPGTRDEVQAITALYGERAQAYLGAEATEERVKALGPGVRALHLAAHGIVDERFPLSSAVALTIRQDPAEGQDNGLLQAWEVFERVRLDCDVVVLSACQSAVGKEVAGEGLIGLTRAFQYAGAHAVLASLWSVADVSTAELMKRFYAYRKGGDSTDVALQKAQVELIRAPVAVGEGESRVEHDLSHPFFWAAFQLYGDWR